MPDRTKEESSLELIPLPAIQKRIVVVRKRHVMVDEDLAELYGVQTGRLIEQVKRNIDRFPSDFMFQLKKDEAAALRSQSATSKEGRGGRRYAPYVFTEQGVAMLSGVLRSQTAVAVNIAIMRAFVELRRVAASYTAIERRLEDFERETKTKLGRHDQQSRGDLPSTTAADLSTSPTQAPGWFQADRRRQIALALGIRCQRVRTPLKAAFGSQASMQGASLMLSPARRLR